MVLPDPELGLDLSGAAVGATIWGEPGELDATARRNWAAAHPATLPPLSLELELLGDSNSVGAGRRARWSGAGAGREIERMVGFGRGFGRRRPLGIRVWAL